ncbi:MAG: hypothetical protein M9925_11995 [Chloroflexi bacterium]|nr:hypothetical protein [Dehalococcoidia bacterium]MCO5202415.1 hypothetical protein [Chloroflexota bacterium]MCZ7576974.1 hypothetical protein [Dehalococcoidia bacterium]
MVDVQMGWEIEMLEDLARAVTYPATPDLERAVASRLGEARPARTVPAWRLALGGLAAAVVAFAVVLAASKNARDAVADFLGLAVEGERIEVLPTAPAETTATPLPTSVPLDRIARRVTLTEAAAVGGFEPVLPSTLGVPAAVYLLVNPEVVVVDYGAIQVWEFELADEIFVGKGVTGGGDVVAPVTVNGKPGYWITGGERLVTIMGADGTPVAGTRRTVAENALVWADGGLYRRIEGPSTLEEAQAIAESMR